MVLSPSNIHLQMVPHVNIPPQHIFAKSKGGLIIEGGVSSSEYGIFVTFLTVKKRRKLESEQHSQLHPEEGQDSTDSTLHPEEGQDSTDSTDIFLPSSGRSGNAINSCKLFCHG